MKRSVKQLLAWMILICWVTQSVGFADTIQFTSSTHSPTKYLEVFRLNSNFESFGNLEDVYIGENSKNQIILIQDAHMNTSAQHSIQELMLSIHQSNPQYREVFLEAGFGEETVQDIQAHLSDSDRHVQVQSLLYKGLIQGVEAFALLNDHPVRMTGIEDRNLYNESLKVFLKSGQHFAGTEAYRHHLKNTLEKISQKILNTRLRAFYLFHHQYQSTELPLTEYTRLLDFELNLSKGPSSELLNPIQQLSRLKNLETSIDFEKVNQELSQMLLTQPSMDLDRIKVAQASTGNITYLQDLFREIESTNQMNSSDYPELKRYQKYLREISMLDLSEVTKAIQVAEDLVFEKLIQTDEEGQLIQYSKFLSLTERVMQLQADSKTVKEWNLLNKEITLKSLSGWMNRKLIDLNLPSDHAIVYSEDFQECLQNAIYFYDLALRREDYFMDRLGSAIDEGSQQAFLIIGGYHADRMKELMKEKNISYLSIQPHVRHETDYQKYTSVLRSQTQLPIHSFEGAAKFGSEEMLMTLRHGNNPSLLLEIQRVLTGVSNLTAARLAETPAIKIRRDRLEAKLREIPPAGNEKWTVPLLMKELDEKRYVLYNDIRARGLESHSNLEYRQNETPALSVIDRRRKLLRDKLEEPAPAGSEQWTPDLLSEALGIDIGTIWNDLSAGNHRGHWNLRLIGAQQYPTKAEVRLDTQRIQNALDSDPPEGHDFWTSTLLEGRLNIPRAKIRRYIERGNLKAHPNYRVLRKGSAQSARQTEATDETKLSHSGSRLSEVEKYLWQEEVPDAAEHAVFLDRTYGDEWKIAISEIGQPVFDSRHRNFLQLAQQKKLPFIQVAQLTKFMFESADPAHSIVVGDFPPEFQVFLIEQSQRIRLRTIDYLFLVYTALNPQWAQGLDDRSIVGLQEMLEFTRGYIKRQTSGPNPRIQKVITGYTERFSDPVLSSGQTIPDFLIRVANYFKKNPISKKQKVYAWLGQYGSQDLIDNPVNLGIFEVLNSDLIQQGDIQFYRGVGNEKGHWSGDLIFNMFLFDEELIDQIKVIEGEKLDQVQGNLLIASVQYAVDQENRAVVQLVQPWLRLRQNKAKVINDQLPDIEQLMVEAFEQYAKAQGYHSVAYPSAGTLIRTAELPMAASTANRLNKIYSKDAELTRITDNENSGDWYWQKSLASRLSDSDAVDEIRNRILMQVNELRDGENQHTFRGLVSENLSRSIEGLSAVQVELLDVAYRSLRFDIYDTSLEEWRSAIRISISNLSIIVDEIEEGIETQQDLARILNHLLKTHELLNLQLNEEPQPGADFNNEYLDHDVESFVGRTRSEGIQPSVNPGLSYLEQEVEDYVSQMHEIRDPNILLFIPLEVSDWWSTITGKDTASELSVIMREIDGSYNLPDNTIQILRFGDNQVGIRINPLAYPTFPESVTDVVTAVALRLEELFRPSGISLRNEYPNFSIKIDSEETLIIDYEKSTGARLSGEERVFRRDEKLVVKAIEELRILLEVLLDNSLDSHENYLGSRRLELLIDSFKRNEFAVSESKTLLSLHPLKQLSALSEPEIGTHVDEDIPKILTLVREEYSDEVLDRIPKDLITQLYTDTVIWQILMYLGRVGAGALQSQNSQALLNDLQEVLNQFRQISSSEDATQRIDLLVSVAAGSVSMPQYYLDFGENLSRLDEEFRDRWIDLEVGLNYSHLKGIRQGDYDGEGVWSFRYLHHPDYLRAISNLSYLLERYLAAVEKGDESARADLSEKILLVVASDPELTFFLFPEDNRILDYALGRMLWTDDEWADPTYPVSNHLSQRIDILLELMPRARERLGEDWTKLRSAEQRLLGATWHSFLSLSTLYYLRFRILSGLGLIDRQNQGLLLEDLYATNRSKLQAAQSVTQNFADWDNKKRFSFDATRFLDQLDAALHLLNEGASVVPNHPLSGARLAGDDFKAEDRLRMQLLFQKMKKMPMLQQGITLHDLVYLHTDSYPDDLNRYLRQAFDAIPDISSSSLDDLIKGARESEQFLKQASQELNQESVDEEHRKVLADIYSVISQIYRGLIQVRMSRLQGLEFEQWEFFDEAVDQYLNDWPDEPRVEVLIDSSLIEKLYGSSFEATEEIETLIEAIAQKIRQGQGMPEDALSLNRQDREVFGLSYQSPEWGQRFFSDVTRRMLAGLIEVISSQLNIDQQDIQLEIHLDEHRILNILITERLLDSGTRLAADTSIFPHSNILESLTETISEGSRLSSEVLNEGSLTTEEFNFIAAYYAKEQHSFIFPLLNTDTGLTRIIEVTGGEGVLQVSEGGLISSHSLHPEQSIFMDRDPAEEELRRIEQQLHSVHRRIEGVMQINDFAYSVPPIAFKLKELSEKLTDDKDFESVIRYIFSFLESGDQISLVDTNEMTAEKAGITEKALRQRVAEESGIRIVADVSESFYVRAHFLSPDSLFESDPLGRFVSVPILGFDDQSSIANLPAAFYAIRSVGSVYKQYADQNDGILPVLKSEAHTALLNDINQSGGYKIYETYSEIRSADEFDRLVRGGLGTLWVKKAMRPLIRFTHIFRQALVGLRQAAVSA